MSSLQTDLFARVLDLTTSELHLAITLDTTVRSLHIWDRTAYLRLIDCSVYSRVLQEN